jgi:signal transduction histidine kinase/DNA-binding response OmpR family regulator
MPFRLNSLKTRTAVAMSSVIVVILVFNAVYLILSERTKLRRGIEDRALTFALLTRAPICTGYEMYYASGFYKFRELMRDVLRLDQDVEKILIVNVNGQVLFDSSELDEPSTQRTGTPAPRWVQEPERLEAVKRLEHTQIHGRNAAGEDTLEIIAPFIEDWGRHKLSVSYQVSYKRLQPDIIKLVYATGGLTLFSILISVVVAVALASRITKPLEELTAGAQDISEGHFDRHLDIRSNDELQILAETFNHMTEKLKENVEELEESNKKLAAVNEELKELDRMKSDLLANVSHELRTPLTAIKGYTDYILERKLGTITEKQEKGLVVVQRNLDRLSKSINALLDFSRMDMGRIALNIQPFSLQGLVEQIAITVRSELDKKHLTLSAEVAHLLPAVIADREKLSAVLENLVINAIKFTPEGGRITVAASKTTTSGARPAADIRVQDSGIGIPRDQLGRIFNRFHQVDGSSTRRFGGVGLGLAIVKSILDAHGSAITVESEEGRGTLFRFTLPVVDTPSGGYVREDERSAVGDPLPSRDSGAGGLVLVIDDDVEMVHVLRGYLEQAGFSVLSAATATEGAPLVNTRRPDVILLDVLLPERSGLELLQSLKRDPSTRSIPILVVSVMNDTLKGLRLGAADYLTKPVDRARIVDTVRPLLDGNAPREPLVLVVDDEPDTAEVIRDTLKAEGFRTLVAHHGREALEVIGRTRPDVVILDIMMPEMTGFLVLEALSGNSTSASIPVVILTARGDDADVQRGFAPGAKQYMNKPFDVGALIAEVRRHVGIQEPEKTRRASL